MIDPFGGNPLVYRRTDDGFTLHAVGADGKDGGGLLDSHRGEDGGDFVFWPPQD